jgi:putative hydroxymethylpyrimidine transport system substrate-binding protein
MGTLLLAACGGGGGGAKDAQAQPESSRPFREVTVTLDGNEGPENVGILMAQERGYFTDAHLTVTVLSPVLPARPVQYVTTRQDDLGVTQEPQLAIAKAKGTPVIAVGSLVHQPSIAMIWLKKSHIDGIADLKGKTIAIPGVPFQKDFLVNLLARHGLTLDDVKVESFGFELVRALVSGEADAIFGGSWNLEGVELELRGLNPVITRPRKLGFPPYDELTVIARTDRLADEPGLMRDFMSAVARGTAAAVEDPRAAVDAIESSQAGLSDLDRKTLEAQVAATLPLLSKSGYIYPEQSLRLTDWMRDEGMMKRSPTPAEMFTDDFASWRP